MGLVSERSDQAYQAGRSKHWVKVKNCCTSFAGVLTVAYAEILRSELAPSIASGGAAAKTGELSVMLIGQRSTRTSL